MKEDSFISDRFDRRTMANMEVALDRALSCLSKGREEHAVRSLIAGRILACAEAGDTTLGGLTKAGRAAANEISPPPGGQRRDEGHRPKAAFPRMTGEQNAALLAKNSFSGD